MGGHHACRCMSTNTTSLLIMSEINYPKTILFCLSNLFPCDCLPWTFWQMESGTRSKRNRSKDRARIGGIVYRNPSNCRHGNADCKSCVSKPTSCDASIPAESLRAISSWAFHNEVSSRSSFNLIDSAAYGTAFAQGHWNIWPCLSPTSSTSPFPSICSCRGSEDARASPRHSEDTIWTNRVSTGTTRVCSIDRNV